MVEYQNSLIFFLSFKSRILSLFFITLCIRRAQTRSEIIGAAGHNYSNFQPAPGHQYKQKVNIYPGLRIRALEWGRIRFFKWGWIRCFWNEVGSGFWIEVGSGSGFRNVVGSGLIIKIKIPFKIEVYIFQKWFYRINI